MFLYDVYVDILGKSTWNENRLVLFILFNKMATKNAHKYKITLKKNTSGKYVQFFENANSFPRPRHLEVEV